VSQGQELVLSVPTDKVHRFDAESEERIQE
jgi:hypothetical protein